MPVAMRLMRMGTTHNPVYRISIGDSRKVPTAKFVEHIGTYNPKPDKMGHKQLRLNVARAKYWIAMGCQPSTMVARLLSRFHLLPVPPSRITVPAGTLLHQALAGEDLRPTLRKLQQQNKLIAGRKAKTPEEEAAAAAAAEKVAAEEALAAEELDEATFEGTPEEFEAKLAARDAARESMERRRESEAAALERESEAGQEDEDEDFSDEFTLAPSGTLLPQYSLRNHRFFREPTPQRIAQLQNSSSRWKLQKFPFELEPTGQTLAAWEQARRHHYTLPQHPPMPNAISYRQMLRAAERRRQRRRERFEDEQAGRKRTEAMQVRDVEDDLDEVDFRRFMRMEAPPALGQEDTIDVASSLSSPASKEALEARETARSEALAKYESEVLARAKELNVDVSHREVDEDVEEDEEVDEAELAAEAVQGTEADAELQGSDGEGEEEIDLFSPDAPRIPLSRAGSKAFRLMMQAQNLGEVDRAVAYRASTAYQLLNSADREEVDALIYKRAQAIYHSQRALKRQETKLSAMDDMHRSRELMRRARAWVLEHGGAKFDPMTVARDNVHYDVLEPEERVQVLAAALRRREMADIEAYIAAQKAAKQRNEAKQAKNTRFGTALDLEEVDEQAILEYDATRPPTAEEKEAELNAAEDEDEAEVEFDADEDEDRVSVDPDEDEESRAPKEKVIEFGEQPPVGADKETYQKWQEAMEARKAREAAREAKSDAQARTLEAARAARRRAAAAASAAADAEEVDVFADRRSARKAKKAATADEEVDQQ